MIAAMRHSRLLVWALPALFLAGCGGAPSREIWIYTSLYKDVYPLFEPGLQEAFPGVQFKWYQSGSEKIAARILAEEKGGGTKADLLMTSDLFFYQELAKQGLLLELGGPTFEALPAAYRDPGGAFAVHRIPLMVLAYNPQLVAGDDVPRSFEELLDPRYAGRLTMPSPLESGSTLTTCLYLYHAYGMPYFEGLRRNDVLSAGGNGATLSRIQSGERPVGMVLMENVLKAKERGQTSVEMAIPEDGALAIPSPAAIFKHTADPDLARRVLDWFFTDEARAVVVRGWMYTIDPGDPPPAGAPPWPELTLRPWDLATFAEWGAKRQEVKTLFHQIVLQ